MLRKVIYFVGGIVIAIIVGLVAWLIIKGSYEEIGGIYKILFIQPNTQNTTDIYLMFRTIHQLIFFIYVIPIIIFELIYAVILLLIERKRLINRVNA